MAQGRKTMIRDTSRKRSWRGESDFFSEAEIDALRAAKAASSPNGDARNGGDLREASDD